MKSCSSGCVSWVQKKNLSESEAEDLWKLDRFFPLLKQSESGVPASSHPSSSVEESAPPVQRKPEVSASVPSVETNLTETGKGNLALGSVGEGSPSPSPRRRRVGISIRHPQETGKSVSSEESVGTSSSQASKELEQPVLLEAWVRYAGAESASANLSRTMQCALPQKKEGNSFEVKVSNRFQESELINEWTSHLKEYIEKATQCREVHMEIKVEELEEMKGEESILTNSEAFEKEKEKNPALRELANLLELESE